MRAERGAQLTAKDWRGVGPGRHAVILEVLGKDGAPPYRVRWLDTGHESVVHPTPDCYLLFRHTEVQQR